MDSKEELQNQPDVTTNDKPPNTLWSRLEKIAIGFVSAATVLASVYLGHYLSRGYDEDVRESREESSVGSSW